MVTKKQSRVPGRPRRFAPEQAISAAKVLFHQKGFDAVSVAEVTDYLGINPPSLYAAFGSKAGLFSRVLNEYVGTEAIPLADILRDDRPVGECLVEVLKKRRADIAKTAAALAVWFLKVFIVMIHKRVILPFNIITPQKRPFMTTSPGGIHNAHNV